MGQNSSAPTDRPSSPSRHPPARGIRSLLPTSVTRNRGVDTEGIDSAPTLAHRSLTGILRRTHLASRTEPVRNLTTEALQNLNRHHGQNAYDSEGRSSRRVADLGMPAASINNTSAVPLPRPRSMISRMATNIHHRYSTISVETGAGPSLWTDEANDNSIPREDNGRTSSVRRRLSTLSRRHSLIHRSSSQTSRVSISRPIPQQTASSLNPDFATEEALRRAPMPGELLDQIDEDENTPLRSPRQSRISRFRHSISGPMDLWRNSVGTSSQLRSSQRAESPNLAEHDEEDSYLLPPIDTDGHGLDMDQHTGAQHSQLPTVSSSIPPSPQPRPARFDEPFTPRTNPWVPNSTPNRIRFAPTISRAARAARSRSFHDTLRDPLSILGRSSLNNRDEEHTPLGRILQLAATAIAAQLSGNTSAISNLQSVGDYQFDGNLNQFVEELSSAPGAPGTPRDENTPPLNFWRVFRFDNHNNGDNSSSSAQNDDRRTVTLVVVGVQSVPSSSVAADAGVDASLEALLTFPSTSQRSGQNSRRQRPGRYGSTRGIPAPAFERANHSRNLADVIDFGPQTFSTSHSESPPGPYPPPSTPAERLSSTAALLSASEGGMPSRFSLSNWARRRSSNMNGANASTGTTSELRASGSDPLPSAATSSSPPRRRRSDSETARMSHLRRNDSRRHGVVGSPHDNGDPNGAARSWLIYVIGTNLPEDSQILDLPNLFDVDANSYEDLLRLQELIGVVRPPTASAADLCAAGGIFVISVRNLDGSVVAKAVSGSDIVEIQPDGTCIICQSGYAIGEEIRRLGNCPHVFHKGCIDEWLITGRNSCPLCRNQGVNAQESSFPLPTYGN